jgi:hypothetical protein
MSNQQNLNEAQRAAVRDAIAAALTGVYYCGRVWSAWNIGTMSQDDFQPAADVDEVLDGLTDAAMAAMSPPAAEKVACPECKGSGDTSVHAALHHGEPRCTDCNGKGFNWEPVEGPVPPTLIAATPPAPAPVISASAPSCELCNKEYGFSCTRSHDWCLEVHGAPPVASAQ